MALYSESMMDRRVFLCWIAGLVMSSPLRGVLAIGSSEPTRRGPGDAACRALIDLFSDPRDARSIGSRYLAAYPAENTQDALLSGLDQGLVSAATRKDPALRQRVADCQRDDFARGDTVLVNNWVLSCTEARICAIAALTS